MNPIHSKNFTFFNQINIFSTSCLFILIIFFQSGCVNSDVDSYSEGTEINQPPLTRPTIKWGLNEEANHYRNLYIAGEPNKMTVFYSKSVGIELILDVRSSEIDSGIEDIARNYQIDYQHFPLPQNLKNEDFYLMFSNLTKIIEKNKDSSILLIGSNTEWPACLVSIYKKENSSLNATAAQDIGFALGLSQESWNRVCAKYFVLQKSE